MQKPISFQLPEENRTRFLKWAAYILGILFLLNCFTPLRLHYDMLRYFAIKDCIEARCPPEADPHDYLPYGYTVLLIVLSKLGVLRSFSLVLVNCLYLFGGLYFVRRIFSDIRSPFFFICLVLLNWTIIKFVTHPLSELQYLFFSIASIYTFCSFIRNKNFLYLFFSLLLAGLAFLTRTVGIALMAALIVSIIWEYRKQLAGLIRKNRTALFVLLTCVITIMFYSRQLGLNHYTGVFSKQFAEGLRFTDMIGWHFSEWGEIGINTSRLRIIGFLPGILGGWLFIIAGIAGIGGFAYICFFKKSNIPFIVRAYLFFYILLMFNWPFPDPRFWVPVIPLIAGVVSQATFPKNRMLGIFGNLYLLVYSFFGLVSLGYMTYTAFNKKEFSKTQAKGAYRNEYEVHFFGKPLSDTVTRIDPYLVEFLNRYDK